MLKYVLSGIGCLIIASTVLNISIKLFASDDAVLRYAGSSRNLDIPLTGLAVGLAFLGLAAIIDRLDTLLEATKSK